MFTVFGSLESVDHNVCSLCRPAAVVRCGCGKGRGWSARSPIEGGRAVSLDQVFLADRADALAEFPLAHGGKRKLEIAPLLLAGKSKVLLLDGRMAWVSAEDIARSWSR